MLYKILIFLSFSCLGTSLYSQPTEYKGAWEFKIKDGCKTIKFSINKSDTIFVDTESRYQLKIKQCGTKCFSTSGNKIQLVDGIISFFGVRQIPQIMIEIIDKRNAKEMNIKFLNYKGNSFSSEFKFKEGNYSVDVNKLFKKRMIKKKKGYKYYFIRQKYFERKK